VVPTVDPGHGGEGRADAARFSGAGVEVHTNDAEEGV
jgi:hypothetical protein